MRALVIAVGAAWLTAGCVKEISSDERLDRATENRPVGEAPEAAELAKINCQDAAAALAEARNVNRPETDRIRDYITLYASLVKRTNTFDEAMTRNPDLLYRDTSQQFAAAREQCVQQTADVRVEFDGYVRELVNVPTVQELKGGNTITVARVDFDVLREAIETLAPDDKEQMFSRIAIAEKRIGTQIEEPSRGRRR
jgi:hypothetical protein